MKTQSFESRTALRLKAARLLVTWDWRVKVHSFESLYRSLQNYPVAIGKSPHAAIGSPDEAIVQIEDAVQFVSIWYWKRVLCLQRSCCLLWMLRDVGVPARLQIGAQQWPPKTHAWVNVEGRIVGDLPHRVQPFRLLDTV